MQEQVRVVVRGEVQGLVRVRVQEQEKGREKVVVEGQAGAQA